jgi:hypothetical protein
MPPLKTKEEKAQTKRDWAKNNRDKIKLAKYIYRCSPQGIKKQKIDHWIGLGIKDEDFESLYEAYLNETNCWIYILWIIIILKK